MLSEAQRVIIRSTVPLLETGGEALTKHFYQLLLTQHPELRPLFNQAHQASGDQQRALANGVLMYARNIDRLEELGGLASQIIQKHVSLQVLPEHYPLVGQCLLQAIREVLGTDIATDAVIDAWAAAYGQLADILIGAEKAVYDAAASDHGGWRGTRTFRVERKVQESTEITSLHLVPVDGGPLLRYKAGQYLGVCLIVDGQEIRRNYSLSQAPNGREYRISVKREAGGVASNYLHGQLEVGTHLGVFPPAGDFTLTPGDRPVALISGGVGITPTIAMLEEVLYSQPTRPIHFIHAARSAAVHAFRISVDALAAHNPQLKVFYCYEEPMNSNSKDVPEPHARGRLSQDLLLEWLPHSRDLDAYFLGPKGFMKQIKQSLVAIGVAPDRCRYEFFGPASALD